MKKNVEIKVSPLMIVSIFIVAGSFYFTSLIGNEMIRIAIMSILAVFFIILTIKEFISVGGFKAMPTPLKLLFISVNFAIVWRIGVMTYQLFI